MALWLWQSLFDMQQIGVFLALFLCGTGVVSSTEEGSYLQELRGRGLDIGGGLSVHLDSMEAPPNSSIFERNAIRLDYNGVGVRFRLDGEDDEFKVGLYYGDGRAYKKKEVSEMIVPALLGYKTSALVIMSLFGAGLIVFKAFIIAKMAVIVAATFWMKKFFGGGGYSAGGDMGGGGAGKYNFDSSHLHPVYAEYPGDISELGYAQTASGNYIAYASPQQDTRGILPGSEDLGVASSQQYTYAEVPKVSGMTGTAALTAANATSERRRTAALSRPQAVHTYITVKRKSARH